MSEFWALIDSLESISKKKRENKFVTADQFESLHHAIVVEHGGLAGRAFTQLSAHLLTTDLQSVVQAIRDLDDNSWVVTPALVSKMDKVKRDQTEFQRAFKTQSPTVQVARYNKEPTIYKMPDELKGFLKSHFNELNDDLQFSLPSLQPVKPSSPATQEPVIKGP